MATKPVSVDWERIEVLYRAGVMSVREIGIECGVSHTAINKRAAREGWKRDLRAKIKAEADAKVSKALVSREVSTETKVTEKLTVEVEATVQARIRLAHRADIGKCRGLAMKLLAELEHQTDHGDLYEQLFDLLFTTDADDGSDRDRRRREAFERAMSLSARTKTVKDLADTLRILIDKEREAFNIGDAGEGGEPGLPEQIAALMASLHQSGAGRLPMAPKRPKA